MWIPSDAAEIERAAASGRLEETPSFDAKAQLPETKKKNVDVAIDVAAMSTDGGVLLYGVGEDDSGLPSVLRPLQLDGARERVDQIVQTSIAEPPTIEIKAFPRAEDPSTGYLAIVVPQSPRAPHQVVVRDTYRFYGRGPTGNRVLTESDIARLYERRRTWEVDRDTYLDMVVAHSRTRNTGSALGYGVLHAFARPVAGSPEMLADWLQPVDGVYPVQWFMKHAERSALSGHFAPSLTQPHRWRQQDADSWRLTTDDAKRDDLAQIADMDVFLDGSSRLMYGCATNAGGGDPAPRFFEIRVAGALDQFLIATGAVLSEVGYYGAVDVGVDVRNLEGAISSIRCSTGDHRPYRSASYRRTARVAAAQLTAPKTLADQLITPLIRAISGYSELDIWERATRAR